VQPKLTFLNHSSFSIETEDSVTLVDPWFSEKIFNDSWSLLKDTDDSEINYSKLKYISISHEHPDHLHFSTLKYIKSKVDHEVTILYPKRKNPNVKEACEKIGFNFIYLDQFETTKIEDNYSITVFPAGHDNCLVYSIGSNIIVNQNDAYLDSPTLSKLKKQFPAIDLWLFQFSLAGYYGNSTEPNVIKKKGTYYHEDKFLFYENYLEPKTSVPFASFVYFCKEYNKYINDYAVKLEDIVKRSTGNIQIPWYNEELVFNFNGDNKNNLENWDNLLSKSTKIIQPLSEFCGEDKIINKVKKLINEGYYIGLLALEFFDYDRLLAIDTNTKNVAFF
jgi:UDP-MurNAc hydroxylase